MIRYSQFGAWLRDLTGTVGSFDSSALETGYALRCTIGVAIPLVIAASLGRPALGVAPAIGAFITGFTSLQGIYRTRLSAIFVAALGMSATSFVGALTAHSAPAVVAAAALAGYACGTIGQIGPAVATVALNSLVAFVVFSSQALPPGTALQQSVLVFGGGLIQGILLLIVWPTARLRVERIALADVYRNLAAYAREIGQGSPALPPITPFATARQVLADPQPFARAGEMARLERLLEDSEVIRKRLGAFATTPKTSAGSAPKLAFLATLAKELSAIAEVLDGRSDETVPDDSPLQDAAGLSAAEADTAAHVRDAALAAAMLSSGRLPTFHLTSQARPGPYVRNHVEWLSRESLRFALVLGLAMILARHFAADRGYWIPLTAALVLKPDFQTTFVRGVARIAGTLVGAIVATFAIALVRGHDGLQIAGMILTAGAAYWTFNPNYALFTVAITSFVVMALGMRGFPGTTTIDARVLDTLAGGALAMIGYLALPTWERKRTGGLLADLIDAQRRLAGAILRAYANPTNEARAAIERARTAAWKIRTMVEASIDRLRHEPQRRHAMGAIRALRILSATQRFGLASLALETALETRPAVASRNALNRFADALNEAMKTIANALRESRRTHVAGQLIAAQAALNADLDTQRDPTTRFILDRTNAYVEAATRLARLVGSGVNAAQL